MTPREQELWRLLKLAMTALEQADPVAYQIIADGTDEEDLGIIQGIIQP